MILAFALPAVYIDGQELFVLYMYGQTIIKESQIDMVRRPASAPSSALVTRTSPFPLFSVVALDVTCYQDALEYYPRAARQNDLIRWSSTWVA